MPKQLPYDTSFAYAFQWGEPERDLNKALQILNAQLDEQHDAAACLVGQTDFEDVEVLLVSNPSTPAEVLDHIAQCVKCPKILERIAGHPNVDSTTLKRLADSEHGEVRSAVADNGKADLEILRVLAEDGSIDVRFCLAENPNVPGELLQLLAQDDNPYVAYRAQQTLTKLGAKSAEVKVIAPQVGSQKQRRAM